jgi:hypothetical protein
MHKILKSQESCPTCRRITIQEEYEVHCDNCDKIITEEMGYPLKAQMFHTGHNADQYDFCSWNCVRTWIIKNAKKFKEDPTSSFMTIEYVVFSNRAGGKYPDDFDGFLRSFIGYSE